jgi:hypothetical protein
MTPRSGVAVTSEVGEIARRLDALAAGDPNSSPPTSVRAPASQRSGESRLSRDALIRSSSSS